MSPADPTHEPNGSPRGPGRFAPHDRPEPAGSLAPADPLQLSAPEIRRLLAELDARLRKAGVSASLYIVGGAAMVLTGAREGLTVDIDAVSLSPAVWEAAQQMAAESGLPGNWINSAAAPYIPPREPSVRATKADPGLKVDVAPDEHLLAMKLIASRAKDRDDILALIARCGMSEASPADFSQLLRDVYAGEGRLEEVLRVPTQEPHAAEAEIRALGELAARLASTIQDRPDRR